MKVDVLVGERKYAEDLAVQAGIAPNMEAINEALSTNPGRFAEWAMLEALARERFDGLTGAIELLDSDIKEVEATIYLEMIEPPETAIPGWKAPTVDAVKALVTVAPRRRELVTRRRGLSEARLAAKADLEKVAVGRKTIEEKKDSLIAMSANWRQEMQTQLTVSGRQLLPGPLPGR